MSTYPEATPLEAADSSDGSVKGFSPAVLAAALAAAGESGGLISGIRSGLEVTINGGDNTKFDVAAGTYDIVDYSDPVNPVALLEVVFAGATAVTVTDLATESFTSLYITPGGVLTQVGGALLTPQQKRQNAGLEAVVHGNFTNITSIASNAIQSYQASNAILDYIVKLGPVNEGNTFSGFNNNLQMKKLAGTTTLPWINRGVDAQDPATSIDPAQSPVADFSYAYRDGSGGFTFDLLQDFNDPDQYDDGSGTLAAVPNNKWTVQRIFFFGQNQAVVITYGQVIYNSHAEADAAIILEDPDVSPLLSTGRFVTALVIKKGATDNEDVGEAEFHDITGLAVGGSAMATAPNPNSLQDLFDRFVIPLNLSNSFNDSMVVTNTNNANSMKNDFQLSLRTTGNNGNTDIEWDTSTNRPWYLQPGNTTPDTIDWDRELAVYTSFTLDTINDACEFLAYYGREPGDTTSAPDDKMIGFEIRNDGSNNNLFLITHDGTSENAVDSTVNVADNTMLFVTIVSDGSGNVSWFTSVDGVTFTEAPAGSPSSTNTPTGSSTVDHISIDYGATNTTLGTMDVHVLESTIFTK